MPVDVQEHLINVRLAGLLHQYVEMVALMLEKSVILLYMLLIQASGDIVVNHDHHLKL